MSDHIKRGSLACALTFSLLSATVFAQSPAVSTSGVNTAPATAPSVADVRNERVRSDVLKMVAEAKAGRAGTPRSPQLSPSHSNHLSKTAKIAIVVGVIVVIVAIIVVKSFDPWNCKSRCVI
jgi:hypothetical protein